MKKHAMSTLGLCLAVMVGLSGCGGGGGAASFVPGSTAANLVTGVGWYFNNTAPDYFSSGATCTLQASVYYDSSITSSDIASFTMTSPTGVHWTVPAANSQFGTSSSGKPYVAAALYYGQNRNTIPLAGTWTVTITLTNGQTSSPYQLTFHEPGSATAATHSYLYTQEDWTPSTNASEYVAALQRFPSAGYTVQYSAAQGRITTTGLSAVNSAYLAAEPKAYNMNCWLYDANKVYLGRTTMQYSTVDHSSTNLIGADGELSILPSATVSATASANGQVDLSAVKYIRFVHYDGVQYVPLTYGGLDQRSVSSFVPVSTVIPSPDPGVSFGTGVRYPVPTALSNFWCGDTAMGDLNGDGRNDVVVIESFGSRILVYYQNAAGTFDPPQVITTSIRLSGVAVRDINNDGLADLVVSGNSTTAPSGWMGRVAVFRQDPATHALNAPQEYVLSTNAAGTLAIADLNSDGLPDIVVASAGSSSNGLLSFFFQGAGGTLGTEYVYTAVPVVSGGEIHVADMNSDGYNDIVVQSGNNQLGIVKQLSPGVYSTSPDIYTVQITGPFFRSFALGDLNGDGRADIVVADQANSGFLNIFLQNATGTLTGPTLLNFSFNVQDEVKIADIDGDGLNDIIVLSYGYTVQVFRQPADHTFMAFQTFHLPTLTEGGTVVHQAMSIGDVTGDGLPDIVASWDREGLFVLPRK
jgi:hypothetical protein